ncbi:Slc44a1 [Symbiodinium natans]|uniref:Choline transporter-like protein n=1 Tax=Symbiodinium natans TaxID=878477 RepID=A0A812PLV1_9DINO|nr:Slc44a1 [Symbiodinium natans]
MAQSVRAMGMAEETETQPEVKDGLEEEDEEEEDLRKNPPLPGHVDHRCTDVPFLLFFLLVSAGVFWISYDAIKHGNVRKLGHGYNKAAKVCKDVDFSDGKVFWCLNSTENGLMLDVPICVPSCPISSQQQNKCWDSSQNAYRMAQDYPSRAFGYFCKPLGPELKQQIKSFGFDQDKGPILRLWGVLSRTWFVLVMAAVVTGFIGYCYILLLFISPDVVATWCTIILTVLPIGTGAWIVYTTANPGSALAISFLEDSEFSTTERYVAGVALLVAGGIASFVASGQRKYIEATTFCLDTAGDCLTEEWSILLEPLISVAAKVCLTALGFFVLFNLASMSVVEKDTAIGEALEKERYIQWSTQEKCKLFFFLIYLVWLEEAVVATSRYVMAYATEVWYFTEPDDEGRRQRSFTCLLVEAYWNVLRYHVGSTAMGSFMYTFGRIPAMVLRNPGIDCWAWCWNLEGLDFATKLMPPGMETS